MDNNHMCPLKYPSGFFFWAVASVVVLLSVVPLFALFILFVLLKGALWINDKLVAGKFSRDISKRYSTNKKYENPQKILPTTLDFVRGEIIEMWNMNNCNLKMVSRVEVILLPPNEVHFSVLCREHSVLGGYHQLTYPCSPILSQEICKILSGKADESSLTPLVLGYYPDGTEMFVFRDEVS